VGEMIEKTCAHCGKSFTDYRNSVKFCSPTCSYAQNKLRSKQRNWQKIGRTVSLAKVCLQCGRPFETTKTQVVCCSRECQSERSIDLSRQNAARGGRFFLFQRDDFQCIYCGASPRQDGVRLEIDHILPMLHGGNSTAANLVTACEGCNQSKKDRLLSPAIQADLLATVEKRNLEQGINGEIRIAELDQKRVYSSRPSRRTTETTRRRHS
jgi:5-methylcytosine-specific restriction endonuclease McrA